MATPIRISATDKATILAELAGVRVSDLRNTLKLARAQLGPAHPNVGRLEAELARYEAALESAREDIQAAA